MRNDLIVFEFENDRPGEILLNPDIVTRLATILEQMFSQARHAAALEDHHGLGDVGIWLAAVERGSIRIAFRALFHPDGTQDKKEALENSVLAADLFLKLGTFIVGAGAALGALISWVGPEAESKEQATPPDAAENLRWVYDELLAIGYASEVDRVLVSFPDQRTMMLAINPDLHANALGKADLPIGREYLNNLIEAELRPASSFIDARIHGDQDVRLYMGRVAVANASFPVLFRWNSRRALPTDGDPITVRGRLSTFQSMGIRPLKPVGQEFQAAALFLDVDKQVVAE